MMKVLQGYIFAAALLLVPCVFGFAANRISSPKPDHEKPSTRPNFHQVLQQVGKSVLRPGGSEGTKILHEWAHFQPADTALELSSGLGTGGMALARRYGCRVALTDKDESRLRLIRQDLDRGLHKDVSSLLDTRKLDMLRIEEALPNDEHFEAVVVEASLSHMSDKMKGDIMKALHSHTNQLLLHEICLGDDCSREEADVINQSVGAALRIGFLPISVQDWKQMLETSDYEVTHEAHGPLKLLNPKNLWQDEGPAGIARIAWNLASKPALRERVISTKKVLDSHSEH